MKQGDAQNKATRVLYDPEAQKGTLRNAVAIADGGRGVGRNPMIGMTSWLTRPSRRFV